MSQGQRFRRRALRRGYKVDEVDSFLDRVEATLSGDPMGAPVSAQEVHDVVFRVRFGGYDEWQVDLHLDRVERQLAELEERGGGGFGRALDSRGGEMRSGEMRMAPERMPERMQPERMGPPPMERMQPERMGPPPMERMQPERMGPPPMERMQPERMGPPPMAPPPPLPPRPAPTPAGPPRDPNYGRYDEPTYGGAFDDDRGYEAPRQPRADMTAEIRMDRDRPEPATYGGAPDRDRDPYGGGPDRDPYGEPYGGPPQAAPVQHQSTEVARIDQLRRTFQLRRFGSGYDRAQVDRLFEGVMASLSGRGGPLTDGDLDPSHFNLVPGGYFEAEVDAALKEVRDLVMRRR
ncbi:DivIVA domain-containing protein [Dactylosporangium sp. NPDC050588]|uniref:DivIVA domain-containing protein n=1 Tax=Dactylosporangium sp. NPDC050588 TaxID=3157211 RepID=UPI0033F3248E